MLELEFWEQEHAKDAHKASRKCRMDAYAASLSNLIVYDINEQTPINVNRCVGITSRDNVF